MRLTSAQVTNFRSIANSGAVELGAITVLIGENNSGKSAFLHALYQLQVGSPSTPSQLRLGAPSWSVSVEVTDLRSGNPFGDHLLGERHATVTATLDGSRVTLMINRNVSVQQIPAEEPRAYIYPMLAKRKVAGYQRNVDLTTSITVRSDWTYLVSRLTRVSSADFPGAEEYRAACREILGFVVTTFPAEHGLQAGLPIDATSQIELEAMGEGVASIAGLLVELANATGKLFLIEEPENDLHPKALKAVLELIRIKAASNQFIVSTHSNIVLRHLASDPGSRLIRVGLEANSRPPTSTFTPVESTPEARFAVLRDLGYELADFDLYEAWLVLEESSAELLIRQYLVKWFVPELVGRLRTIAAAGASDVEPRFRDLHRLCLYGHLEEAYRGRLWAVCDGDPTGTESIASLRSKFQGWPADRFRTWSVDDFEQFYPDRFGDQRAAAFALQGKRKREAKRLLLESVLSFIAEDETAARAEFEASAKEVIDFLHAIRDAVA